MVEIQMANIYSACHDWATDKNVVPGNSLSKLDQTGTDGMLKIHMTNICSACHMSGKTVKHIV